MKRRRRRASLAGVTKKDFTSIASILCNHGSPMGLATDLSRYFGSQNPRFNEMRFLRAVRACRTTGSRKAA